MGYLSTGAIRQTRNALSQIKNSSGHNSIPNSTLYPPLKIRVTLIKFQNFTGNLENMKKLLLLVLLFGAFRAKAQMNSSIDLRDSTITRVIPVEVPAGTKTLKYSVKVDLTAGEATLTFNDPNGKKEGGFTVNAQKKGGGRERSKVESSDSNSPPITGTWKLTIRTQSATGRITYDIDVIKP